MGREAFIKRVWEWKKQYGGQILEQIKELGSSVDWTREAFTMDDNLARAVRKVFVQLYKEGLIYKGKYIVNWCPALATPPLPTTKWITSTPRARSGMCATTSPTAPVP